MDEYHSNFHQRVGKLNQKHAKISKGYIARVQSDGLITVEPKKPERARISLRPILFVVLAVVVFKGFLMASLGFSSYDSRVAALTEGSMPERIGAFVMQSDPLSVLVAEKLVTVLR